MKIRIALGLTFSALALAACVSLSPKAPPVLLNLTSAAVSPSNQGKVVGSGDAMIIAVPLVPQAIANNRVAVSDGPVAIAYVKDAVWVEPPAKLFQRLLSETVSAKTGKTVIDPRQLSVESGLQLTGQLKSFGIDAKTQEAVVIFDAALSGNRGKQLQTRRFEARTSVSEIAARPAGIALNQAANEVAQEVATWITAP